MLPSDHTESPAREPRWGLIYTAVIVSLVAVIAGLLLFSKAWTP